MFFDRFASREEGIFGRSRRYDRRVMGRLRWPAVGRAMTLVGERMTFIVTCNMTSWAKALEGDGSGATRCGGIGLGGGMEI
jgi:hypothetical protein